MEQQHNLHEDLSRAEPEKVGSDRSFGIVFAVVFSIVGAWPLLHGASVRPWWLGAALVFAGLAFIRPGTLAPLNRLWMRFGRLLHAVMSPIILGLLFYAVVTPTGLLMRVTGRRPLGLLRKPADATYWILRDPPGPPPESMKNQF